jgi:hypothetical protein
MHYKQVCFLVEGRDDLRFFEDIVKPLIIAHYNWVKVHSYQTMSPVLVDDLIKNYSAQGVDIYLTRDLDTAPCFSTKKAEIRSIYKNIEASRIVIVKPEIEAWYLAGIDKQNWDKLKIAPCRDVNAVTKDHFERLKPRRFASTIDFMNELRKVYSPNMAREKSPSFSYLLHKLGLSSAPPAP